MIEFLTDLGFWAWNPFWVPMLVWSAFGLAMILLFRAIPRIQTQFHLDIRLALLLALPIGVLLANAFQSGAEQSNVVFVVPTPGTLLTPLFTVTSLSAGVAPYAWLGALTIIALLLTFVGLVRLSTGLISLRRIIRSSYPIESTELIPDIDELRDRHEHRLTVRILVCPKTDVAFSCGLFKRLIVVPSMSADETRMVLLHELQHHRDGDIWRAWFGQVVTALFFFHPLVHVLQRETRLLVELSCDQALLERAEVDRAAYASLLLKYARQGRVDGTPVLCMSDTPSHLKKRIKAMKHPSGRVMRGRVVLASALILLVAGSLVAACSVSEMISTESDIQEDDALGLVMARPESLTQEVYKPQDVDQVPQLIGGLAGVKYKWPATDCPRTTQGRIFLQFVVMPDGSTSDIQVIRGLVAGCDAEAVRVVSEFRLVPGLLKGERVRVTMGFPFTVKPSIPDVETGG